MARRTGTEAIWEDCEFPEDLGEWVGRDRLVGLALSAVQTIEDHRIDRGSPDPDAPGLPARMMLTLLTCSYAVGLYGSNEIQNRLRCDPMLRYLSVGKNPGADYLRRFRNKNRELIAGCLGQVFGAAGRRRLAACARLSRLPGGWVDQLFNLQCLCTARQRVTRAELADGLWLQANS